MTVLLIVVLVLVFVPLAPTVVVVQVDKNEEP